MSVRRRIEKLKAAASFREGESGPRVWAVLPCNDPVDLDEPTVNRPVVIVPRRWDPAETDAFLAALSRGRPAKVVSGVDYDRL